MAAGIYCCNTPPFPHEITKAFPIMNSTFKAILQPLLKQNPHASWYFETEKALKRDKTKFLYCKNTDSDYLLDNKNGKNIVRDDIWNLKWILVLSTHTHTHTHIPCLGQVN